MTTIIIETCTVTQLTSCNILLYWLLLLRRRRRQVVGNHEDRGKQDKDVRFWE
jgi:hypothetical protein